RTHVLDGPLVVCEEAVAHAQLVPFAAVVGVHHHARGALAEAHQLALVARAQPMTGAAEVERLQQIRLPRSIGSMQHCQAFAQARFRAGIGAEVTHLDGDDSHTFKRMGIMRYTKSPLSGDSIRPGRSGLMSFRTSSSDSRLSSPSRRNSGLKPISKGSPWKGTGIVSLASPTSGVRADTASSPSRKPRRS